MKISSTFSVLMNLIPTILIILTLPGCSSEKDEYSFPPLIYDEEAYLREIEAADNLLTLNTVRSNYAVALKKTKRVTQALEEKWNRLVEEIKKEGKVIGQPCEEVELISFDFEQIGPDRHRLFFLFHVLKEFKEKHGIYVLGKVDDPSQLPEKFQEREYMKWHFNPLPPVKFWEEGEYVVISQDITAPDLPFRLRTNFDTSEGRHGIQIPLGRMRKLEDLTITEKNILSQEDPYRLWDWLQSIHARSSGPKIELIRKRFKEVTAGLQPEKKLEEGIEYYGSEIKRINSHRASLRLLFKCTAPIEKDYYILLYGMINPEDRDRLSAQRRQAGKLSERWRFEIFPITSTWEPGEFVVISQSIAVQAIAYDLFVLIYDREARKTGSRFEIGILPPD